MSGEDKSSGGLKNPLPQKPLPKKKAYLVFEGGGAKGIAHAGTAVAFEQNQYFDPQGYAGTSAGAIIASLLAVGYQPREIFNLRKGKGPSGNVENILDHLPDWYEVSEPVHLFTRFDWFKLKFARQMMVWAGTHPNATLFLSWGVLFSVLFPTLYVGFVGFVRLARASDLFPPGQHFLVTYGMIAVHCLVTIAFLGLVTFLLRGFRGAASLEKFVDCMDFLFKKKLRPLGSVFENRRPVTFGDLARHGIVLKVVAANLTLKSDMVFSTDDPRCANLSVAEAVAASIAIPFVFVPRKITIPFARDELTTFLSDSRINELEAGQAAKNGGTVIPPYIDLTCMLCDGGVVSNLPAWVFDGQTVGDKDCWVVTSETTDISDRIWYSGRGLKFVFRLFNTAVFGASRLNVRQVPNILRLVNKPEVEVFDFDASGGKLYLDTMRAYGNAGVEIAKLTIEEDKLLRIHGRLLSEIKAHFQDPVGFRLRAALVERTPEHSFVRLWSHVDFDGYADKWLELPLEGTMIERCMESQDSVDVLNLKDPKEKELFNLKGVDDRVLARTPADICWSMAFRLPDLGDQNGRSIALALDCNFPFFSDAVAQEEGGLTCCSPEGERLDKTKLVEIVTAIVQSVWMDGSARNHEKGNKTNVFADDGV